MKTYFGGMPTGPDVRKLTKAVGCPAEGSLITHEQLEQILEETRTSGRYRVVVTAWRKKLLADHNVDTEAEHGQGLRVLRAEERISKGIQGVQAGVRKQLRSIKRADRVQTDNDDLLKKQTILRRYGAALAQEAGGMLRQIQPPKPAEQQIRLAPVPKKSAS